MKTRRERKKQVMYCKKSGKKLKALSSPMLEAGRDSESPMVKIIPPAHPHPYPCCLLWQSDLWTRPQTS